MTDKVSDEMLMAYVDGETDAENAAAIERILADDAALARRAEMFRASRRLSRQAFGDARAEPVPDFPLKAATDESATARVVPFARRPRWRAVLPLAASLAVAFGVGFFLARDVGNGSPDLLARTAIAEALGATPSGESSDIALGSGDVRLAARATYRVD